MTRGLAGFLVLALVATPAAAQRGARLEVALPNLAEPPLVRAPGVLSDRSMRDLLRNGFPARLHYRVELWSESGWFNQLVRAVEWDMIVQYDALNRTYRVARITDRVQPLGTYTDFAGVEDALAQSFAAPIRPPTGRDEFYYNATLDVQTLSLSDLDEVERWLRGELRPAVRGERNAGTALGRGLRTLFLRLLGAEQRRYEVQTRQFRPRAGS